MGIFGYNILNTFSLFEICCNSHTQGKGIPPQMVYLTKGKQKRTSELFWDVQNGHGAGLQLRERATITPQLGCQGSTSQSPALCLNTDLVQLLEKTNPGDRCPLQEKM